MKAMVYTQYGPPEVLEYKEVEKPQPKDDEVLVAIRATSVNFNTLGFVMGKPFLARMWSGLMAPKFKTPGNDIAGQVEAVGRNVTKFKPGDLVFGDVSNCGWGAYAEYVAVPERFLTLKPANISFEQAAAALEAALVALQALRNKGRIKPGQKVLIYGASGGIGTFAVQIAKSFGAEVTGVCSSRNLEMVRAIGADHVIDYTQEDFTKNGQHYDIIMATAGFRSIYDYRRALKPDGIYVSTGGSMDQTFQAMLLGPLLSIGRRKKLGAMMAGFKLEDQDYIANLLETGKVVPVIDRCYPLSEAVNALQYYAKGRSRGKVVITVSHNGDMAMG